MNIVGLESLDEDSVAVYQRSELIAELESIQTRVATEGMTRDDAVLLERIAPGIFEGININKFTVRPSTTKQSVAVEAIDWKRGAMMVAAAMAIISLISKVISWLSGSLETTGSNSGGIKDIDTTNAKIEKRCQDNFESDVVTEENLQKVGSELARKVGKLSNVNMHYINELVKRADAGKVVDSKGKQIAPNDVSNAVNKYVDAVKRTRASDRDAQLHALLGYMLVSKQGGIPLSLTNLDWKGGTGKHKLGYDQIMALELTINIANDVIDEIGTVVAALDNTKYNTLTVLSDDKHIDGSTGGGNLIYGLLNKSNETLIRVRNTLETNYSLRATYDIAMATEIVGGRADVASLGRVLPDFSPEIKELLNSMKENANTYLTFWDKSDYQNYTNKVDVAHYIDLITALADPKGREGLAQLYRMVYDTSSNSSKPKAAGALKTSNERLNVATKLVGKMSKRAGQAETAWISMPFAVAGSDGFNADSAVEYIPMAQLKALLDTASALCRRAAELASVVNMGLRDADRSISMTEKMK